MQHNRFIFFFLLFVLTIGHAIAQTDGEDVLQMLVEEIKTGTDELVQNNPNLRSVEVEAKDGILIYNYIFKKGKFNQPSDEEIQIMKQSIIPALKASFNLPSEEDPEEDDASIEELFQYLNGFRFVYIEEKTLKGYQIDISSEEILNS